MNRSTQRTNRNQSTRAGHQRQVPYDHLLPPGRIRKRTNTRRTRSAHFEKYAEEGNRIIGEIANELGIDDHRQALRITRAVLHALRDRLQPVDSIQFAQGLPMMLKAVYFDGYSLSHAPLKIRRKEDFLEFIRSKDHVSMRDFRTPGEAATCLQAVLFVLSHNMDPQQVEHIKRMLPMPIQELIDAYEDHVLLNTF